MLELEMKYLLLPASNQSLTNRGALARASVFQLGLERMRFKTCLERTGSVVSAE